MISRKYDKKVEIWNVTEVSDGFGGFVVDEIFIKKKWTFITTQNSNRTTDNGTIENYQSIVFYFRGGGFQLEKTNFIIYKGSKYVIDTIENVNLTDVDLKVYCTQYNG